MKKSFLFIGQFIGVLFCTNSSSEKISPVISEWLVHLLLDTDLAPDYGGVDAMAVVAWAGRQRTSRPIGYPFFPSGGGGSFLR